MLRFIIFIVQKIENIENIANLLKLKYAKNMVLCYVHANSEKPESFNFKIKATLIKDFEKSHRDLFSQTGE